MSEAFNFSELAQVKVGEVERPKTIPAGHYTVQFSGPMKQHKAKSGNMAMRFPFKVLAAGEDVDADQLEAAGGLPTKEYNLDFWMSPDARFRFTDFGKAMGASDNLNLLELAEWLIAENQPFSLQAKHRQGDKPEDVFIDWDNPTAVE